MDSRNLALALSTVRISVKRCNIRKEQVECDEIFARLSEFLRLPQSKVNDAEEESEEATLHQLHSNEPLALDFIHSVSK